MRKLHIETPLIESVPLSQRISGKVWLKMEALQPSGSFKLRGAYNKMVQLPADLLKQGVIAASAGNQAQGGKNDV